MNKCSQDKDEQLQRFRKAMPKNFWWTDQVKTCKSIDRAWEILDIEFADKRKMMDELLGRINNQKSVRGDSKSLTRYATQIAGYVNDMEDNDCSVTSSSEAPFFMSQLLSKLDPRDNAEFGREMKRNKKQENVSNLVQWLHDEASLRSRGKFDPESSNEERSYQRGIYNRRTDNHSGDFDVSKDGPCPFGCEAKHWLAACPHYQSSTVDQRWEIVKQNQRCRKCLRPHHTRDCKKIDGTTCDKCKKNHHRSLHNDRKGPKTPNLDPNAAPFQDPNHNVHVIPGETSEPIAKMNCFGWYILGQLAPNEQSIQSIDVGTMSVKENIDILLQQDQLGVKPTKFCTCTDNELRENKFVRSLSESTTQVDGRIQVKMPWKEIGPPKKSNYDIALKRMYSTEKSLKGKKCTDVVAEEVRKLVDQGFVIKIPSGKVDHSKPEWYLPLQAVFTPEKTTKVRLVFDSSCEGHNGLSLNDHLEKGPNYINDIPEVLAAWRWDNIAYAGDVRKMFNQILVHPEDQVFHRFLWSEKPTDQPTVYQWLRLSFGDKPAPDIATKSIKVLAKAAQPQEPQAAAELLQHVYVDDVAGSRSTVEEVQQVTTAIDSILENGKFEIKTWHLNSTEIDQSEGEKVTDLLGHKWDKETDKFTFKREEIPELSETLTKRNCLALLAKLWDPIGMIAPVTIKFRIDLQELWCSGYGWDDVTSEEIQRKWKENLKTMNSLLSLEFDRKLKPTNANAPPEIHGFYDAGDQAYGAVLFLRWELIDGSFVCVPVIIKAFVAPAKKKSIPRLEL